jgi:tRNA A37 methylthiotransferase MiaB
MLAGKTPQFKTAIFRGVEGISAGDTVNVRVGSTTGHSLMCSII